ncbi:MAG: lipid carrier--UDP-N-acetylgalactosaminyltransferase [Lachnospiraceae bacterium]|nr:lipid carrier--UDP-N-acetylgalactosaminyltransferase [Lachnospiraceae bacterium]
MEKLLLVGSGGLGRVALESARESFECSFVDDGYPVGTQICGAEVVGNIDDLHSLFFRYTQLVVSIGDNALREKIYRKARTLGYTFPNIICSSAYISPYARIGDGCIVLNNACVQNGSKVGNGVVLNAGVEIHHDSFVDDYALIYTNSVIRTQAKIGKRVKIGSNVTISNGIVVDDDKTIENGCTLLL